jgi:hypothetical protein
VSRGISSVYKVKLSCRLFLNYETLDYYLVLYNYRILVFLPFGFFASTSYLRGSILSRLFEDMKEKVLAGRAPVDYQWAIVIYPMVVQNLML